MQGLLAARKSWVATHLLGPYKANDVYGQLYKDNLALLGVLSDADVIQVQTALTEAHIGQGRGSRFVDLLVLLCSAGGIPIPRSQNKVSRLLYTRSLESVGEPPRHVGV